MTTQQGSGSIEELRAEPMMNYLVESLQSGTDIGHYGRLVFAMIARHFLSEDEMVEYLTKNPGFDEPAARGLLNQIEARGYNPPKRKRILEWMQRQEFPICPNPSDPNQCNVYRNIQFPSEVYEKIAEFYEREGQ